ncbi:hypothetical protein [Terrarubrum flagellatum]|uniref:hypothetical protein n=1 Tax=Terrirubrum flagellatum TaxID=2895980 RepID=UPI003144DCC9
MVIVLNILALITIALAIANALATKQELERARSTLIDYWVFVQDLAIARQVDGSVSILREFLKRNRLKFLALFGWALAAAFVATLGGVLKKDKNEIEKEYRSFVALQYSIEYKLAFEHFGALNRHTSPYEQVSVCKASDSEDGSKQLDVIAKKIGLARQLIDSNGLDVQTKRLIQVAAFFFSFMFFSVIGLLSLSISIFFTLKILRAIHADAKRFAFLVALDLFLATVTPAACIVLTMFCFSILGIQNTYALLLAVGLDRFGLALVVQYIAYETATGMFVSDHAMLWITLAGRLSNYTTAESLWYGFSTLLRHIQIILTQFPTDVAKFLRLDWSIPYTSAITNWSLVFSLAYSFAYILPMFAIVSASRSLIVRETISRSIQWLAEHEKGPVSAVAVFVAAALVAMTSLMK